MRAKVTQALEEANLRIYRAYSERHKLEVLRRRRAWLQNIVESQPERDLTYSKAEIAALTFAIELIEKIFVSPQEWDLQPFQAETASDETEAAPAPPPPPLHHRVSA